MPRVPVLMLLVAFAGMPVRAGFLKTPGAPAKLGLAAGPFRRQWRLSLAAQDGTPALRLTSRTGEKLLPLTRGRRTRGSRPLQKALRFLAKRIRAERLDAALTVDTGDARTTVLFTALLTGAFSALAAARPALPLKSRVECTFRRQGQARLMGIFSVRGGHIMLAALVYCREYCVGRIRAWKSTPSKT